MSERQQCPKFIRHPMYTGIGCAMCGESEAEHSKELENPWPICKCGGVAVPNASGDITRTCIRCGSIVKPQYTCCDCGVLLPCKLYEHREGCSLMLATSSEPMREMQFPESDLQPKSPMSRDEVRSRDMARAILEVLWGYDPEEILTVGDEAQDLLRVWERIKAELLQHRTGAKSAAPAPRVLTREQVMKIIFPQFGQYPSGNLELAIARLHELGIEVEGA